MDDALIQLVWDRARQRCEYCQLSQAHSTLPFEIDHVIARKHGGRTIPSNLALSCFYCNSYKGPNIAGLDPNTRALARLFHPRRHKWTRHFRWDGPVLVGRTAIGRTTIVVLDINDAEAVAARSSLIEAGLFPPS
jgi:HNH endonuclease